MRITGFRALLLFHFLIIGCQSPSHSIETDIRDFKAANPHQPLTYNADGRTMQYAWSGDATKRPIVFVHGSPGSWEGWAHFLQDQNLAKQYQLISVDRPGYGGSGKGQTEVSLKKQSQDIIEVLKINKSGQPAFLIGHSYGGAVIAQMAMDYPQQIAGLIFVASSVSPDLEKTKWFQYPASWWPFRSLLPSNLRVCNEEILPLKEELEKIRPRWKDLQANIVIIQGEDDSLVPPGNQDFILQNAPAANIVQSQRLPGINHFIPWEHPAFILEAIDQLSKKPAAHFSSGGAL
jgi:pimeloyl-ACP methyl ester carboxylesterase